MHPATRNDRVVANQHSDLSLSISSVPRERSPGRHRRTAIALIVLGGLALYLPGVRWGLPATVSWSQDTIAGVRTLGAVETWPGDWHGRYPPLHYFVLRAVYEPVLRHWDRTGVRTRDESTGLAKLAAPHAPKIGLLILIARLVSVAMAIGAAVGIFCAAMLLTGDRFAASVGAMVLMTGAAFTYFAHLGNVDIPATCWFAWSIFFYARLLRSYRMRDALLLGLFGSLAISTKDSTAGVYPGMAIILLVAEIQRHSAANPLSRAFTLAVWQPRWLVGIAAFALPYLFINGVFFGVDPYLTRMQYWLGITPDTLHLQQYRHQDQLRLMLATLHYAAGAVGWPMLMAIIASTIYALVRQRRVAFVTLVPAITYYLIIIAPQGFVYSRFLFVPLSMCGILVGVAATDLWRNVRFPLWMRVAPTLAVMLMSVGYAAAIDLEMCTDSRYAAESWFEQTADPNDSVGAFSDPQYLPRLNDLGTATYRVDMTHAAFERPQPDYLVLSSYNYEDFDGQRRVCLRDLLAGRLGYIAVASFKSRYIGSDSSWLSLAGWGAPTPGKISPAVTVLRRRDSMNDSP